MTHNQIVPAPLTAEQDHAWREREHARLWDGTYKRLPKAWSDEEWFSYASGKYEGGQPNLSSVAAMDHYAHLSLTDGAKIAFTESAAKGAADRQTVMKPGKYLAKYFSHVLSPDQITKLATEFCAMYAPAALLLATDADEIERVYTTGPHSCMVYKADHFAGPCHPARVYAGPDLAVAYINKADGSGVAARAVCWPEKKIYSTVYGDAIRLETALEAAGYTSGDLDGARVQKISAGPHGYVMPYVDGVIYASVRSGFIVLGDRDDSLNCQNTNGITGEAYTCCNCDDGVHEDETYHTDNNGPFCEACYDEATVYCDYYEARIEDEAVSMANGDTWSLRAFEAHGGTCAVDGCNYPHDDMVCMSNGDMWSQRAFENGGFTCEGDGDNYPIDECVTLHDGTMWSQDYFDKEGEEFEGEYYAKGDAPRDEDDKPVHSQDPNQLELEGV